MDTIRDFSEKIKAFWSSFKEEVLLGFIIVLVSLASFGLGKMSVSAPVYDTPETLQTKRGSQEGVSFKDTAPSPTPLDTGGEGEVVASKSGKKYHYPWCGGAKKIAEKNKISFNSIEEARRAGYTPAGNCKGLQ